MRGCCARFLRCLLFFAASFAHIYTDALQSHFNDDVAQLHRALDHLKPVHLSGPASSLANTLAYLNLQRVDSQTDTFMEV